MTNVFAIIPAAGSGSRFGGDLPKQYLDLMGRPLIWHTLDALLKVQALTSVLVVLAPGDAWWQRYDCWPDDPRLHVLRVGGATRAASVSNALESLGDAIKDDDWVLVHDAARACVETTHVETMIDVLATDPVGGLLAVPVADTLKRADTAGRVADTVSREGMWQAQTPQMFRYAVLRRALAAHPAVTDEASAIEALGLPPKLIAADATNFKVTFPQDVRLAELILRSRRA
ncbi:MAG: 2-C-methyl-D-erythritol 4-phosphate cytidylyltransferase [Uliginosibacterium sp.]|nr:2-C-methyl-D-erythritol 4-phosphate cytidylyltransferase [Uliginosibacterium sp.]